MQDLSFLQQCQSHQSSILVASRGTTSLPKDIFQNSITFSVSVLAYEFWRLIDFQYIAEFFIF